MAYNYYPYFQQPQQAQPQMQSSFLTVRSEAEARNYPVAYGNSVTFKDETSPYIYTKTMGFSQLDRPIFDKYRLIKEESPSDEPNKPQNDKNDKSTLKKLEDEIGAIWREIEALKKEGEKEDEYAV